VPPPAASAPCRSRRRRAHSTPGSIPAMMTIHAGDACLLSSQYSTVHYNHKPPPQQTTTPRADAASQGGPQRT
jgi:hypothetical protein